MKQETFLKPTRHALTAFVWACAGATCLVESKGIAAVSSFEQVTYTAGRSEVAITGVSSKFTGGVLTIPEKINNLPVKSIANDAFLGVKTITATTLPSGLTSIGVSSFKGCTGISTIVIPNNVTFIPKNAFLDCKSLKSVTFPQGLTAVLGSAFENCTSLTQVVLPKNVIDVKDHAFNGCVSLASLSLPEGLQSIGGHAFDGAKLTALSIPGRVSFIGDHAFAGCSKLPKVTFTGGAPGNVNDRPFDSAPANFVIYYNKGSVGFPAKFGGLARYTQKEISSSVPPTVIVPPVIASQPVLLQKVVAGQSATFSVTASGLGEISYQWKRNGAPVSGATGRTFIIVAARSTDAGNYTVVISNSKGSVTSAVAVLEVSATGSSFVTLK